MQLGPGEYNVSKEIGRDAPKYSFGRRISQLRRSEMPGPGEYNPRESLSSDRVRSPVIKMGERFPPRRESQSPDPGNYHRDQYFAKDTTPISLKGKIKDPSPKEVPGPGAYDPSLQIVKDAIRTFNIDSSQRPRPSQQMPLQQSPGPGEYTSPVRDIGRNSKSFSMYGKLASLKTNSDFVPGPGTYDLRPLKPSSPLPLRIVAPAEQA